MVEYEMLENSSGYTDKYKICKSITYKEGIKERWYAGYEDFSNRWRRIYRKPYMCGVLEAGYDVVIVDNLYNASEKQLTGSDRSQARRRHFMRQISGIMRK
mgnify:CR=1 FL=1